MEKYESAMKMALNAAEQFVGATAPTPPAGAIALDRQNKVLLGAGHQKAGAPHAEAKVLDLAAQLGKLPMIETLVLTLEPCEQCVPAILKHKNIRRVVIGCHDPLGKGGVGRLRAGGLEVIEGVLEKECFFLIRGYAHHARTGRPYVTLKAAFTSSGSMIPPPGEKPFIGKESLVFAHELRKRSDAIWTGSGTVLADNPEFTVRWLPDHPGKRRLLVLSDRRRRVGKEWLAKAEKNGFRAHFADTLESGLDFLGKNGALEVLVEGGPTLRKAWLDSGLWDESVVINQGTGDHDDEVKIEFRRELSIGDSPGSGEDH